MFTYFSVYIIRFSQIMMRKEKKILHTTLSKSIVFFFGGRKNRFCFEIINFESKKSRRISKKSFRCFFVLQYVDLVVFRLKIAKIDRCRCSVDRRQQQQHTTTAMAMGLPLLPLLNINKPTFSRLHFRHSACTRVQHWSL